MKNLFHVSRRELSCLSLLLGLVGGTASAASCPVVEYGCSAEPSAVQRNAARSTVMLRFSDGTQCTGTLVNNLRGDGRPYILTARHCAGGVSDSELPARAGDMQIIYGYERNCGQSSTRTLATTEGAIHRVRNQDVWLVEALDAPPASDEVYYAGINLGGSSDGSAFGIHHGAGGPKQVVEERVLGSTLTSLVYGLIYDVIDAWLVEWLSGSTAPGSSGSALFDAQGRVGGVMSGGAGCAAEGGKGEYQKLSSAWTGAGTDASLKAWLDPEGTGYTSYAGRSAASSGQSAPEAEAAAGGGSGGGALDVWLVALALGGSLLRRRRALSNV